MGGNGINSGNMGTLELHLPVRIFSRDLRLCDCYRMQRFWIAKFWEQRGYYVIGLDISDKSLKISHGKGIKCVKGNAEELPFKNDTFDLVYSDGLLEHFLDPKPIIKEIFRVSKKYVCTIVPRDTLTNLIHNLILRPPKEYKKKDHEWIKIHEEFSNNVECEKIRFGRLPLPPHVLFILCEK